MGKKLVTVRSTCRVVTPEGIKTCYAGSTLDPASMEGKQILESGLGTLGAADASPANKGPVVTNSKDKPKTSDAAVKLAAELGVDLASVTGTGSGGNITKGDVQKAAKG